MDFDRFCQAGDFFQGWTLQSPFQRTDVGSTGGYREILLGKLVCLAGLSQSPGERPIEW